MVLSILGALFRSQLSLRVENVALRHQSAIYQRTVKRPSIRPEDRIVWSWLSRRWASWRAVLVFVRADYGLNIGTISIGTVAFSDISLSAAVRLRFDGRPASFVGPHCPGATLLPRFQLRPMTGGLFAIETDAKGIVSFEAPFE